jgi:translocation and assembly module TamB
VKALRIIGFSLAGLAALLVVAAGAGAYWLGTGSGRAWLQATIEAAAEGPGQSLDIGSIEGSPFGALVLRDVVLADAQGPWLTIDRARLAWSPSDLLRGTLRVEAVEAGTVDVARAPVAAEEEPEPPEQTSIGLPDLPVSVVLERLAVDRLHLGAPLLGGEDAALGVTGSARLGSGAGNLAAELEARRIDGREGTVTLDLAVLPETNGLDLSLLASEPQGGLVARLAGLPGAPPVDVRLDGDGTLADWRGRLTASAGEGLSLNADLGVAGADEGHRVTVAATGGADALLPEDVRPLVGSSPRLDLAALVPSEGPIGIETARLALAAGTASVTGSLAPEEGRMDLAFEAVAAPGGAPEIVAGTAGWQGLRLDGTASGSFSAPAVTARLAAEAPSAAGLSADRLRLEARLGPVEAEEDPDGVATRFSYALDGALEGIEGLDPALGDALTLNASGALDTADGALSLEGLRLAAAPGDLTASGAVEGWGRSGQGRLDLDLPDLSTLAGLAGTPLAGAVDLGADLAIEEGRAEVTLDGGTRGLVTGIAPADAMLGEAVELSALLRTSPEGEVTLDTARFRGARFALDAEAALAGGRLDADWRLEVPELAPLGEALGTDLAGGLAAGGSAEGPAAAPVLSLAVDGRNVRAAGLDLGDPKLRASAEGLDGAPNGRVDLDASAEGVPLALGTRYALDGSTLALDDLSLSSGTARLAGALRVALDGPAVTGRLAGGAPDLSAFGPLVAGALAGRADIALDLEAPEGAQAARLTADIGGLRMIQEGETTLAADRLGLEGNLRDLLGTPGGTARLTGSGVAAGGLALDGLSAEAEGSLEDARISLTAEGSAGQPFSLRSGARLGRQGETTRLELARLDGRYGEAPFSLASPATLAYGPEGIAVDDLVLRSDEASLSAEGRFGTRALDGTVRLNRIPLALARLADPSLELQGRLDGEAVIAGSPRAPRADVDLRISNAGVPASREAGFQGVQAVVSARWRDEVVTAEVNASTPDQAVDLRATARLPLGLDPQSLAPQISLEAPLQGTVRGNADLARFNDFLATSGDRVAGRLGIDLTLGGTLSGPVLGGVARLDDGRYENRVSGAELSDIQARLVASGTSFRLESMTARTPGGGNVRAEGQVELTETGRIDLRVFAEDARLVQTDLATASFNAQLRFAGDFARAGLTGEVRVRRAEVRVPEGMPPSIVELEVTEVYGKSAAAGGRRTVGVPIPRRKPDPRRAVASAPGASGAPAGAEEGMRIDLDVGIVADNQVFVRGRGLDAELGGKLHVAGTAADPRIEGGLQLIKGELTLLTERFTFTRGTISFPGDAGLVPVLDLLAETDAGDVTAKVAVTGRASEPEITLSSEPELPQDEVLSRVLFGTQTSQLSALQAIQLAQSAAELAGIGGGPGLLDSVRQAVGVDRLEFTSGENGSPGGVAAGRYLSDNVYVGVEQDAGQGGTRARVELDVTDNVQVEADVGGTGGGSLGLKFEWEY